VRDTDLEFSLHAAVTLLLVMATWTHTSKGLGLLASGITIMLSLTIGKDEC